MTAKGIAATVIGSSIIYYLGRNGGSATIGDVTVSVNPSSEAAQQTSPPEPNNSQPHQPLEKIKVFVYEGPPSTEMAEKIKKIHRP